MAKQRYDTRIIGYKDGKAVYAKVARPRGVTRAERRNHQFNRADTGNHTLDVRKPRTPKGTMLTPLPFKEPAPALIEMLEVVDSAKREAVQASTLAAGTEVTAKTRKVIAAGLYGLAAAAALANIG